MKVLDIEDAGVRSEGNSTRAVRRRVVGIIFVFLGNTWSVNRWWMSLMCDCVAIGMVLDFGDRMNWEPEIQGEKS